MAVPRTAIPNCACGMCMIQVDSSDIGTLSPVAFIRLLTTTTSLAKRNPAPTGSVYILNHAFTWTSCTGVVRSITWDAMRENGSQKLTQCDSIASVLDLCNVYMEQRTRVALETLGAGDKASKSWKTIDSQSVKDAMVTIRQEEDVSVKDIVKMIRPVKVFKDMKGATKGLESV